MHRHALIPVFILLFIVPLVLAPTVLTGGNGKVPGERTSGASPVAPVTVADSSGVGNTPLISNVLRNGGFEEYTDPTEPAYWQTYCSAMREVDPAYQLDTYDGSYSARMYCWQPGQGERDSYIGQSHGGEPRAYLLQGESLDFWFKIAQADVIPWSWVFHAEVGLYNGAEWKYIRYHMMYSGADNTLPDNGSQYCDFGLNSTLGVWTNFDRNVTADFEAAFGLPSDSYYVYHVYFYIYHEAGSTSPTEVLIDECSLENQSATEFLVNGDFEDGYGTGWGRPENTYPGSVSPSANAQESLVSANLTAAASATASSESTLTSYQNIPQGFFPLNPGTGFVQFWYRYSGNQTSDCYAYVEFYFWNYTQTHTVRLLLDPHTILSGNSTYNTYARAQGAEIPGVWHYAVVDLGGLLRERGATTGTLYYIQFRVYSGWGDNVHAELLVDGVEYYEYPAHDPGFEQVFYPYYPLSGWFTYDYPYVNRSEDAYAGKYAARLMSDYGSWRSFSRDVYLPYSTDIYFDMWWKLEGIGSYGYNYNAAVIVQLDYALNVIYTFTSTPDFVTNSSGEVFYNVEGFNQTGLWYNLNRNFTDDCLQAFGATSWNVTRITFQAYSATSSPVIVLLDEVHFIDGAPPKIDSVLRVTATPVYYQSVIVRMSVADALSGIAEVGVIYDSSAGSGAVPAEDIGGGVYEATIPALPWGTLVGWCVIAADRCGSWALDDNDGAAYTYTVADDVNPEVEITAPESLSVVAGQIVVHVDASDAGSGVHFVDFYLDSVFQDTDYSPPYEFAVNTRTLANGTHLLSTVAYDYANLTCSDEVEVKVNNDYSGPALSTVQISPDNPEYDEEVTVIVAASDFTDVKNVTLFYRFGLDSWTAVTMSKSATLYTANIPGAPWNTHVSYYIEAYDTFDQKAAVGSETSPMSYTTTDSKAPTIGVTGPPVSLPQSGIVNFTVHVADIGSGVASTEMLVDGNTVLTRSLSSFAASWDTSGLENGVHTVMFVVQDRTGNSASVSFDYTVHNPVGLDPFINTLAGLFASYGFFIGIGTAIIIFAIAKLVIGRRRL